MRHAAYHVAKYHGKSYRDTKKTLEQILELLVALVPPETGYEGSVRMNYPSLASYTTVLMISERRPADVNSA